MKIIDFTKEDLKHLPGITPPGWGDLEVHFKNYLRWNFSQPQKVVVDGKMAGIGTTIEHEDTAWLAHVVVHPDFRRRGIGGEIAKTLVALAKKRNIESVLLEATADGFPVYRRVGFEIESEYFHFKRKENSPKLIPEVEILKYEPRFREEIFQLEKSISDEKRQLFFEPYLTDCQVVMENGMVSGVYFSTMYDGPIFSKNVQIGIELMKLRSQKFDYASITQENQVAIEFLRSNNFEDVRTAKRMSFGRKRHPNLKHQFNRISGALG